MRAAVDFFAKVIRTQTRVGDVLNGDGGRQERGMMVGLSANDKRGWLGVSASFNPLDSGPP